MKRNLALANFETKKSHGLIISGSGGSIDLIGIGTPTLVCVVAILICRRVFVCRYCAGV